MEPASGALDSTHRPQAIIEFRATGLDIGAEDLTRETYTGAVAAARSLKSFAACHVDHHWVPRPVDAAPRPGSSTAWVTFSKW